jgi:uncharacterized membrane protein YgcG
VTSDISVTDRGAVVTCSGKVSREGIEAAVVALSKSPGFLPSLATIWDFSAASAAGLTADDMRALAARVSGFREEAEHPRVAIVAAQDSMFGGARMFAGLNEERLRTTFRVCRDRTEAVAWAFDAAPGEGREGREGRDGAAGADGAPAGGGTSAGGGAAAES